MYYHNYMMGQLFASQVHHAVARDVYKGADPNTVTYVNEPKVGEFMKTKVFAPGRTKDWKALTKFARMDSTYGLLGKGYVRLDMRDAKKMYVRVSSEPGKRVQLGADKII